MDCLTEGIWDLEVLPRHLLVLGAGPIDCEMAQAFRRFGAEVTLLSSHDQILPRDDPAAARVLAEVFEAEGIDVRTNARAERAWQDEGGTNIEGKRSGTFQYEGKRSGTFQYEGKRSGTFQYEGKRSGTFQYEGKRSGIHLLAGGDELVGDALFVAAGRCPNVKGLDLEKAGVGYSDKGIQVDEHLRTTAHHIYAAGDCIGRHQFTHYAGWQAVTIVASPPDDHAGRQRSCWCAPEG